MIPLRDTLEARGPVWITLALIAVSLILGAAGRIPHLNVFQLLLAVYGLWLFGPYVERQLGHLLFALLFLVLAFATGFLIGAIDESSGPFAISLFLPVLAIGLIHVAIAPRSRIVGALPIPFAVTFVTIPTVVMVVIWLVLEMALTAI
ncbi:MAG: rhomboid family intramembrane serine protease [Solirubrobacterales bacterium]|nr:rhomboid family intramembrane serine protease [Solirubrobacterales bacterium]